MVNATAGAHDWIFNNGLLEFNTFTNIVTIPPAMLISIPAALNQADMQWILYSPLPKKEMKK
jgi:hypothetical protein